ncbi:MAG: 5-(carboxyamino)imidazole ribonucleotide mutase [Nitrososphaeraceae archaeon]|nr:5-(carboxyamino)imidazole ribonucleotide mutase [Nitrososphaeraceae archaeon]
MGSDSDLPVMKDAAEILDYFKIGYEVLIVSAHRTPDSMYQYASDAVKKGIKIIIAGAGGSAHLPGMIASISPLPVIGVPIKTKNIDGLDSLLSIVQMPAGIPVATVAINGSKNAGILACQILSINSPKLLQQIENYKKELKLTVLDKSNIIKKVGWKKYINMPEKKQIRINGKNNVNIK